MKTYLKCFGLAVLIELFALLTLLPGLGTIGMRHSASAPPEPLAEFSSWAGFILHLPTILLTNPLSDLFWPIILLTPLTQIVFLTTFFILISRTRKQEAESRRHKAQSTKH